MKKSALLAAAVVLGSTTAALPAAAQDAFGKSGQLAISNDMTRGSLSFTSTSRKPPNGGSTSGTHLELAPAADYFVIDSLSVGAGLRFAHDSGSGGFSSTSVGIGPRVGYNYNFTDNLGIWPTLALEYIHTSSSTDAANSDVSSSRFSLQLFAPVLLHPAPHFFLGLGPYFSTDLSSSRSVANQSGDGDKLTTFGLMFTLGGWFAPGG